MPKLFATLYLDEDVDILLADLLQARGFQATTTVAAGQRGADDPAQLAHAASANHVFLTHNRADFEHLAQHYFNTAQPHPGIIIANRRPVYDLARRVLLLLDTLTADELQNQILYI